jgi:5'-nucleotidase / UDP-sugar diphosphatase
VKNLSLLLLSILLVSCLPETRAPDLTGVPVQLTLLHTSDIHSRVFPYDMVPQFTDVELGLEEGRGPYGGAARMRTIVKQERERAGRVLHLDSGDVFQGAPVFNVFEGEVEVLMHNELRTDAVVAGNHEFDEGARNYADQLATSSFTTLAANYDFNDRELLYNNTLEGLIEDVAIFELDGLSVAVVGMGNLSSITSIHDQDNSLDVFAEETMSTVLAWTRELKQLYDLVIVLTHLSLDDDVEIARRDPNVDIVLGGHLHVALDPVKVVDSEVVPGKQVVVSHAGAFAKYVQRIDLIVQDGQVLSHRNELFPLLADIPEDAEMLNVLEPYETHMNTILDLDRVVGRTDDVLLRFGNDGGDSPLGSLVVEAMQFFPGVETDFGLTNSLGIRTNVQGPEDGERFHDVTIEELFNVLPFDNTITTMFMSGLEVQELFDYVSFRSAGRGCSTQAQLSSARFVMDCANEVARDVTVGGSWAECLVDDDCEAAGEICSGGACGRPILPTETYELATNNFIAGGGSGFSVLENNTTQQDLGISMRISVEAFMEALCPREDEECTLNDFYPGPDGRITAVR